jgi:hypothetical protein
MKRLYKASEWQDACGHWHCADIEDIPNGSAFWWIPARILGLPLEEYVRMLIEEFEVDYIKLLENKDNKVLYFYWDNQNKMRKYKNYINKEARQRCFML